MNVRKLSLCSVALGVLLVGVSSAQFKGSGLERHNFTPAERGNTPPDYQPKLPVPYGGPTTAPFYALDKVIGTDLNINNAPFSPMAVSPTGNLLAVVNTPGNAVRIFDISNPNPTLWQHFASLRTAWGPVSCAFWDDPLCDAELLVACSNSDALLWLSKLGQVHGLLGLPGEPSDLLVDHTRNRCWVSCMGSDVVVEIDLIEKRIKAEYPIPSKHPAFLSFEAGNTGNVIVAPMLSGNNTTVDRGQAIFNAGPGGVLDLTTARKGLPDEDLFRLVPTTKSVEPVVTAAGTVLFAHGPNPVSGEWWMLGTDAKNAALQSEPQARGVFSENRLAITNALPLPGLPPVAPTQIIDLDDSNRLTPVIEYDPTRTVGQPYALAFDSAGSGFITGMLTDNVTELDSTGAWVKEWNVGSIPRGLQIVTKGPNEFLLVLCWGSNAVEVYLPGIGTGLVATLRIGPDPTHALIKAGRKVYYSAAHSQNNNASCNTCHVDGFSDLLAWNLSDMRIDSGGQYTVPVDDKGPLVTQTLRSIRGQNPYHWRGERGDLIEFNGAFEGLLGGTKLDETPGGDFEKFEAFVMSLQERANPHESPRRVVSDKFVPDSFPYGTSAVRGQDIFFSKKSLPNRSCEDCHSLPSGTLNATFRDEGDATIARRSHFVVSPLLSFWRKLQPGTVDVIYADGQTDTLPTLGVALAMTGLGDDLQDFVLQSAFTLTLQDKHDVAAFVQQIDTGFAPLLHKGVRIGYGANCQPPAPLVVGGTGSGPFSTGASLPGPGTVPMQTMTSSVQPAIAPGIADELTANKMAINFLASHAKPHNFDLMVVAQLTGNPVEGLFDPDAQVFPLEDAATTVNAFSTPQLLLALENKELVGMVFPLPLGMGVDVKAFDPSGGGPAVIPGPGPASPPVDPDDDGQAAKASPAPVDPWQQGPRAPTVTPDVHALTAPQIHGYEFLWVTSRVAKFIFFTDVPARSLTEYTSQGGATRQHAEPIMSRTHTVFLRDLEPNVGWDLRIVVTDQNLMTSELLVPDAFVSLDILLEDHVMISALDTRPPDQDSAGTLRFTADIAVHEIGGTAAANFVPVFDVLVHDAAGSFWRLDQVDVKAPGTDTNGDTFVEFKVNGLNVGDLVMINVTNVEPPSVFDYEWSLPDTPLSNRDATLTYTGNGP
jgi:hypothetical protein